MLQTCVITLTISDVKDVDALADELKTVADTLRKYGVVRATPLKNSGARTIVAPTPVSPELVRQKAVERAQRFAQARGIDFEAAMKRPEAATDPVAAVRSMSSSEARPARTPKKP